MQFHLIRKDEITKTRANSFFPIWVRQRELRQRLPIGHSDAFHKSLYSSFSPCHSWHGREIPGDEHALFSLEFSPDGTLLVAGCEDNSFLLFDPLSQKLIRTVDNAHTRCITNVKFLDSRIFATGGADWTISLWDTRCLRSPFRNLWGFSNKIGNLEFSRKNNFLITSGITDTIYIWDMNNWKPRWLFNPFMPHSLRYVRLSPDETKMVISTESGFLLIVHELDLNRIAQDLNEFVVEMYDSESLLQANTTAGWNSSRFVLPKRRRNRLEIVADFPNADCGVHKISALEIHPQGRSVISRSRSDKSKVELICVHDIQEKLSEHGGASRGGSGDEGPPFAMWAKRPRLDGVNEGQCSPKEDMGDCASSDNDSGPELPDIGFPLERRARKRRFDSLAGAARARSPPPGPSSAPPQPLELAGGDINPPSSRVLDSLLPHPSPRVKQFNRRVHVHVPRLTHYIKEPFVSPWYIESLGVSADGRVVCSPFDCGIRLLAFSPECSEQSVSWCGRKPRLLYELSTHTSHSASVLCSKFSPRHSYMLVSGCLGGKLVWYQPVV